MFFPFTNYKVYNYAWNDTNADLFTTTARTMIFVELLSGFDKTGVGGFKIFVQNLLDAPTTYQAFADLYTFNGATNYLPVENTIIIPAGRTIKVSGSGYTMQLNIHVFELP